MKNRVRFERPTLNEWYWDAHCVACGTRIVRWDAEITMEAGRRVTWMTCPTCKE